MLYRNHAYASVNKWWCVMLGMCFSDSRFRHMSSLLLLSLIYQLFIAHIHVYSSHSAKHQSLSCFHLFSSSSCSSVLSHHRSSINFSSFLSFLYLLENIQHAPLSHFISCFHHHPRSFLHSVIHPLWWCSDHQVPYLARNVLRVWIECLSCKEWRSWLL